MRVALVLLLAVSLPSWWRETNSHAAAARGARLYAERNYDAAAKSFARAYELDPSPRNAFNLGTAEIAAGARAQGSARMAEALRDPRLRADAYFNRGTSALRANALEHAVRDLQDALRANPNHAAAKRNLEIALAKQRQQQQPRTGGQQPQPQPSPQQPQPQPSGGQQQPQRGPMDADSLLRSVQQQEQEELRRMKGRPAEGRVGW